MALQQTYSAIKPDAYEHRQNIIDRIETAGYIIVKSKSLVLSKQEAENFYAEHKGKDFFSGLIEFMTSGSIYAMIIKKNDCISDFRAFIGNTDPKKAEKGTIRSDYGGDLPNNAIHASDSTESAEREMNLIF
jgi:nucleoside-diphosphate kinase